MSWQIVEEAVDRVWSRWGNAIPSELRRYRPRDVFRLHDNVFSFNSVFNLTFATTFDKALNYSCPVDMARNQCGGFVTPTLSHETRLIHIHPVNLSNEFDPLGLLVHEYIHFLSHPNFYPKYYKLGGNSVFRVEGATEWLNLQCFANYYDGLSARSIKQADDSQPEKPFELQDRAAYLTNHERIKSWLQGDQRNLGRLLNYVFKGNVADMSPVNPW